MGGPPGSDAAGISVLVVDDDARCRSLLTDVIDATAGFRAVAAVGSGEEALRWLRHERADVVIMDVRMPGAGGVDTARVASGHPNRPLVVLVSGDDRPDIMADPAAHGAVAFVRKEQLSPELLERLLRDRR